jgi:hypothetical protein
VYCADLLQRGLRASGVDALYGAPLPGVRVIEVEEMATANLLAVAHSRLHGRPAMVHLGDGLLALPDSVIDDHLVSLESSADILAWLEDFSRGRQWPAKLALDPESIVPDLPLPGTSPVEGWLPAEPEFVAAIENAGRVAVLAGPGVVAGGVPSALHAFAVAASAGVLNTWGAKGILHWQSHHHLATVGLQAQDFQLGGLDEADLIVATGIDLDESPDERWRIAPAVEVEPTHLGELAESVHRSYERPEQPRLRRQLAAVAQEGWSRSSGPLPPSRVTLHYGQRLAGGGLVAADAGLAGYWIARTFSTTELGATAVPSRSRPGFAAASVLVSRLVRPWRPALAVVDSSNLEEETGLVLEAAARLGVGLGIEIWDTDGPALSAEDHLERLGELVTSSKQETVRLRTDPSQLGLMIEAAGPVVAWPDVAIDEGR